MENATTRSVVIGGGRLSEPTLLVELLLMSLNIWYIFTFNNCPRAVRIAAIVNACDNASIDEDSLRFSLLLLSKTSIVA